MAQSESATSHPRNRRRLILIILAVILLLLLCVLLINFILPRFFRPVADLDGPYTINEGQTQIMFDGSRSHIRFGTIVDYAWDFGDGSTEKGAVIEHKYTKPGLYIVTLTVTDSTGAKDSSSIAIKVG